MDTQTQLRAVLLAGAPTAGVVDALLPGVEVTLTTRLGSSPSPAAAQTLRTDRGGIAVLARHTTDPDLLTDLARNRGSIVTRLVAQNPATPQPVIDQLLARACTGTRPDTSLALACLPRTDPARWLAAARPLLSSGLDMVAHRGSIDLLLERLEDSGGTAALEEALHLGGTALGVHMARRIVNGASALPIQRWCDLVAPDRDLANAVTRMAALAVRHDQPADTWATIALLEPSESDTDHAVKNLPAPSPTRALSLDAASVQTILDTGHRVGMHVLALALTGATPPDLTDAQRGQLITVLRCNRAGLWDPATWLAGHGPFLATLTPARVAHLAGAAAGTQALHEWLTEHGPSLTAAQRCAVILASTESQAYLSYWMRGYYGPGPTRADLEQAARRSYTRHDMRIGDDPLEAVHAPVGAALPPADRAVFAFAPGLLHCWRTNPAAAAVLDLQPDAVIAHLHPDLGATSPEQATTRDAVTDWLTHRVRDRFGEDPTAWSAAAPLLAELTGCTLTERLEAIAAVTATSATA